METDDRNLLCEYAERHSQDAFTALVGRYVNLVYSAALRIVQSRPLAEEVAQSVFTDLSRNAGKLKPDTILTAWLYRVAYRTAVDVVRRESRRQNREQQAVEIAAMNSESSDWPRVEPLLDEAMQTLDETDRAAVLLRYFENQSLREIGQKCGVSDDAAQKRVSRAVEQLREYFAKHGVAIGAGGLAVVVSANAVQAAPAGLAAAICDAGALAAATVAGTAATTLTKGIAMTTLQKTLIAATIVVAAGTGAYKIRQASGLRSEVNSLRQQQVSLSAEIQRLQRERDDAMGRLAELMAGSSPASVSSDQAEVSKLRSEITGLKSALSSAQHQNSLANANTNSTGASFFVAIGSNGMVQVEPSRTGTSGMKPPQPVNLAFVDVNQLQNVGNATVEAGAQSVLWEVLKNEGRSFDQIAYKDSHVAEDTASKLYGHLAVEIYGVSEIAFTTPIPMGEDYSIINFVASKPDDADPHPKSTTGLLGFRRVEDHWYLDQFTPQSQALMIKGKQPRSQ